MFKAHKHAFSALHNGLHRIAGPIHTANREAKKLKAHLERLQTVGEQVQSINEDVKSIWSWLAPAVAYSHALAQVKRLGLSPVEMRQAKNAAWRNTQAIPTSTAAENLRDFAVLRRRLGNTAAALRLLPIVERTKALTAAAPEGGGAFIGCDLPVLRQSAQNRNAAPRAVSAGAYHAWLQTDPMASQMALSAQWKNTQAMLGLPLASAFQKIAAMLSGVLASLSNWLRAHPRVAGAVALALGGLSAALDIGGKILTAVIALRKLRRVFGSLSGDGARLEGWLADAGARFGRWRRIAMQSGERLVTALRGKSGAAVRWLGAAVRRAAASFGTILRTVLRGGAALARSGAAIVRSGAVLARSGAMRASGIVLRTALRGGAALMRSGAMRFAAGVASDVLLPAAAVATAAYAGWKAGGWLNKHVINPGMKWLTNGKALSLGGWFYSLTHHEVNPVAPTPKKTVQVHSTIHLDGRRVAEIVTRHQAQSANRPAASGRSYDASMAAPPIQMSYPR